MNNERRKIIRAALDAIETAKAELEQARDDEQEALDALPDALQSSERGQKMTDCVDTLSGAIDAIEEFSSEIVTMLEL